MSFSQLPHIIGPAPSELSNEDLLRKLSSERDRVRRTLAWFRQSIANKAKPKPKKAKKKAPAKSNLQKMAQAAGLSVEDLKLALELKAKGGASS